jgi:FtsP/CotA-like multicopper oxidase with cupredoxin domain
MNRNRFVVAIGLVAAMVILFGGFLPGWSQTPAQLSRQTGVPDYYNTPNWANSPQLRKFVDTLPPLCGAAGSATNNLGQCIPVAIPDKTTYPGSDYYEIEIVEYREQMHSDLPAVAGNKMTATAGGTKLRGYRQTNTTNANLLTPHYLGPVIVATKGTPVRILFKNSLPTGAGGNLFIPTDLSVMGAGPFEINFNPETKVVDGNSTADLTYGYFTQNRATLHLHGGKTPWISDGTPHQWITPAGETTAYPKGVSVAYVPDMWFDAAGNTIDACAGLTSCGVGGSSNNPGTGAQTFYWTNDQSARLMFYHEHAWGITRLGVYVGQAAGYVINDPMEASLAPYLPADQIPLIIQDKTFVDGNPASPTYVLNTDPTWIWGSQPGTVGNPLTPGNPGWSPTGAVPATGDLWWPHVYMPAQNPFNPNLSGINDYGRWHYGPWFWPPTNIAAYGPTINPYASGIDCNPDVEFCYPPLMPATPNPSWGAEAFMDTPVINGTAYPTITVDPKAYRFRVLNAAHDRFFNLQLYVAADKNTVNPGDPTASSSSSTLVWRNAATGQNAMWYMDGKNLNSAVSLSAVPDPNWAIVGAGDFNSDGKPDILWRHAVSGQTAVWFMDGAAFIAAVSLNTVPDPNWAIVGTGDFNGDGKPDILWRHAVSGQNVVWFMNGATFSSAVSLNSVPDPNWVIGGTGDFNRDGQPDILWRRAASGQNVVWYMNGVTFVSAVSLSAVPDPNWAIVGTGDYNGDSKPDIVWRHGVSGENAVWYMDGVNFVASEWLNPEPDPNWKAKTAGFSGIILCDGNQAVPQASCTEVKMVPAVATPGFPELWPTDMRVGGVPDPATAGPSFIQIMTDGGFLPKPVELPMQPINWNVDVTTFTAGLVLQQNQGGGTLMLGPAERADVIVDFSQYAGKTLILYNDAPAPWPALDPHYDYFTGAPDNRAIGGANTTLPGYGPNTRTLMQIKVAAGAPAAPFDLAALQTAFSPTAQGGLGVFENGQSPIVVGQTAYNGVFGSNPSFPATWPYWGVSRITDNYLRYEMQNGTIVGQDILAPQGHYMEPKAIQDEMGETFDEYGRMSAKLGLELAFTNAGIQTFILQNFVDPATELVSNGQVQIWKITHNGVDTHPVHFHLFEVQVLNRVGWDGFIYLPDPNELGWKETVRISPLEDTIVALRPIAPNALPFPIPESQRPLNPAYPIGVNNTGNVGLAVLGDIIYPRTLPDGVELLGPGFSNLDPWTGQPANPPNGFINALTNFGWEYVWHCHILSHEEADMMRSIIFTP